MGFLREKSWRGTVIRVQPQPEYDGFHEEVRVPGLRFLKRTPRPSNRQFRQKNFWRHAKPALHRLYERCAYTSVRFFHRDGTVDHFLPRSTHPQLAYEWSNYRLTRGRMNDRKGSSRVVDPFKIRDGWFVLSLPDCQVQASRSLPPDTKRRVQETIQLLRLNSEDLLDERCDWLMAVASGSLTLDELERDYPFLSREVRRQGVEGDLADMFPAP